MGISSETRVNIQVIKLNEYFWLVNQFKKKITGGVKNNLDHTSKWCCAPVLITLQRNVFSILAHKSIQDGQK